jgi:hypothetical protein
MADLIPSAKKACAACPFRKTSWPGYLGGYDDAEEFLAVHYKGETPGPCHPDVDYDDPDWKDAFMDGRAGRRCRGQAVLFANSCKLPRNPEIESVEPDPEIFTWAHDFIAHHSGE